MIDLQSLVEIGALDLQRVMEDADTDQRELVDQYHWFRGEDLLLGKVHIHSATMYGIIAYCFVVHNTELGPVYFSQYFLDVDDAIAAAENFIERQDESPNMADVLGEVGFILGIHASDLKKFCNRAVGGRGYVYFDSKTYYDHNQRYSIYNSMGNMSDPATLDEYPCSIPVQESAHLAAWALLRKCKRS